MLVPIIEATAGFRDVNTAVCADAGYHSEEGPAIWPTRISTPTPAPTDTACATRAPRAKANPRHDKSVKSERILLFRLAEAHPRPGLFPLHLSGRQARVRPRHTHHHKRLCGYEALRYAACCQPGKHRVHGMRFPDKTKVRQAQPQALGSDEKKDRLGAAQAHDRGPLRHYGSSVRQSLGQQAARPLHAARMRQVGWAVEVLLRRA